MADQSFLQPVQVSVQVQAPVSRAFEAFTSEIGAWWPKENTFSEDRLRAVIIEPLEGGRWYEVDQDGERFDWGRVLDFEPVERVTLTWQITHEGKPEPEPERASQVDVRFEEVGPSITRVTVTHSAFERHGEVGARVWREGMASEQGWSKLLGRYAQMLA